jgi:hypothetical protein
MDPAGGGSKREGGKMLAGQAIEEAVRTAENRAVTLDHIVDCDGMLVTLESLALIAHDRADYIIEERQDYDSANLWRRIALRIEALRESDSFAALCIGTANDK